MTRNRSILLALLSGLFLAIGCMLAMYLYSDSDGPIFEFDEQRDSAEILKIFDRDRYWLLSSEEYSPEFMLKHRAPNQELKYMGRLKIKTYWTDDKFVGFTAYYMEALNKGKLLFCAINPEFRGQDKGHGERLMRYALDQLKKMGALQVQLYVRIDNVRAQNFYKRMGYYEISRVGPGMYMQYDF